MNIIYYITIIVFIIVVAKGQEPKTYKICSTSRDENQCSQLQRGDSKVRCQWVQDSIECAQRIRNKTADFGVFSAESALHLASLGWTDLSVINELRHKERLSSWADFESVVVVKASHQNGTYGLRNMKFCHPGLFYDKTQKWSETFLKHFERSVVQVNCKEDGTSPAEIETTAMSKYFKSACRPGSWSNNIQEDIMLKKKFPQLCELCNRESNNCSYTGPAWSSNHEKALDCLVNSGDVAYVSLFDVQNFFLRDNAHIVGDYSYLCPNGTLESISNNTKPCVWLSQPWKVIISSDTGAVDLYLQIPGWMQSNGNWESSLREIITADSFVVKSVTIQHPIDYFNIYRDVPVATPLCTTQASWCTTSAEEKEKCEVVRAGGITTGVQPVIECRDPLSSVVGCLNDISTGHTDFAGIDSNFGYLARHPNNLTAALYAETEDEKYASVIVLVHKNSKFERFENLRNSKACFAEYTGIASIAFINTGKNRGFFKKNACNYGQLLGDFFGPSCAPGAKDLSHEQNITNPDSLCELCLVKTPRPNAPISPRELDDGGSQGDVEEFPEEESILEMAGNADKINCVAEPANRYYGTRGALRCLNEIGDVAILERQYLNEIAFQLGLNPNDFRVMCRNGSLAERTGFDVDSECALTTIVDGEVVVRPKDSKTLGITNALLSFDKYFQIDPDFKMYNIFNSERHLLFKDSSIGLVSPDEINLGQSVRNYIKLFENLEDCVQNNFAGKLYSNIVLTCILSIFTIVLTNILK